MSSDIATSCPAAASILALKISRRPGEATIEESTERAILTAVQPMRACFVATMEEISNVAGAKAVALAKAARQSTDVRFMFFNKGVLTVESSLVSRHKKFTLVQRLQFGHSFLHTLLRQQQNCAFSERFHLQLADQHVHVLYLDQP